MTYTVKFFSALNKKPVEFKNIRNFQFTRSRNKTGKANFQLDISPSSKLIRSGWLVEIWRDGDLKYWGQIKTRQKKKGKYKLFAVDANGFLAKRLLTQRPVVSQEASVEIKEKFDGLVLIGDYILSADKFVELTSTSQYWHWEKNPMIDYIVDMGTKVNNLSGEASIYYMWVDPYLNLYFGEEGTFGYYNGLELTNITVSDDIEDTYNKITVEGLPLLSIPYYQDAWTENVMVGIAGNGEVTVSFSSAYSTTGYYSLKVDHNYSIMAESIVEIPLYFKNNKFNLENMTYVSFDILTSTSLGTFMFYFWDETGTWRYYDFSSIITTANTWYSIKILKNDFSGSGDWNSIYRMGIQHSEFASKQFYIDNLKIVTDSYSYTANDTDSQNEYGIIEKEFIARDFYTNAECQSLAETLLQHYKDAKLVINASLDGFIDLYPNSTLEFTDKEDGITYRKALSSITYYVNADGSESAQLTLGDFRKEDIDKILDKLAEINRNYNLLEFPYKLI